MRGGAPRLAAASRSDRELGTQRGGRAAIAERQHERELHEHDDRGRSGQIERTLVIRDQYREPEHDARHAAAHHRDGIDERAETAPVAPFQREREPQPERRAEERDAEADFEARRDRIEIAR